MDRKDGDCGTSDHQRRRDTGLAQQRGNFQAFWWQRRDTQARIAKSSRNWFDRSRTSCHRPTVATGQAAFGDILFTTK